VDDSSRQVFAPDCPPRQRRSECIGQRRVARNRWQLWR